MTGKRYLIEVFVLVLLGCSANTTGTGENQINVGDVGVRGANVTHGDFTEFWADFRGAAVRGDYERVVQLTAFPFSISGVLDDSSREVIGEDRFVRLLPRLLDQDTGLRAERQGMLEFLEQSENPPSLALDEFGETVGVGPFEFEKTASGWMFVRAYLEE